ncbi:amphi-Trp domain-containing protein [Bacillus sp. FJAT-45350]|uniref:amphi-Trp domain-containing protein n=1 Tax=Bacillus sp. FJAT-45350 TaxID=2011014 RepID=UPI000BB7E7A7|nr:amphi-Trp domain-containing protein [Bacillus sp. FJAT-45350]
MNEQNPLVTNTLIKYKEKQSIEELANFLETIAKKLKENKEFTLVQNGEEVTVQPSAMVKTEIEYTQKGDKHSFEFEFDWVEGEARNDGKMEIK